MLPLPVAAILIAVFLCLLLFAQLAQSSGNQPLGKLPTELLVMDAETKQSGRVQLSDDLEAWGIYNGCISSQRIRAIQVLDGHSAMLTLMDGKQVKMRFAGRCEGIKQHGFVYTARNNLVCTQNYSVRVLHTGAHCQVKSLEPVWTNQ